jgi:glycosyltransferase involved in cell wall biosynthesis
VCIVQRRLTHYRVPLFEALRTQLAAQQVQLKLLHGDGTSAEERKRDRGELPWATPLATRYLAGGRLCWQSFGRHLGGADLVIVTQENKLLYNHLLLLAPRRFRLAFWGHGANLQSGNPHGLKERFKRWTTNRVDWWFAYTRKSADLVRAAGFPDHRISVLNNAVDTSELLGQRLSMSAGEIGGLRLSLGLGGGPVGVFVGSLYADKRLDFLFTAADRLRQALPDFQLLLLGDGPQREAVVAWCGGRPWARWLGARFGREKVAMVAQAQIMLNPGLVGLGILDSFVCGVPMLTTDCGVHSPEIAYLEHGVNGLMTPDDLDAYVAAGVQILRDARARAVLQAGCAASAREYTLENMVSRFAQGIARSLSAPPGRGGGAWHSAF